LLLLFPNILLRKRFTKAVTFSNFLDSSKNFRPCKELVGKYLKKNILSKKYQKSARFKTDAFYKSSAFKALKLQMQRGNILTVTLHPRWW